MAIFDRSPKKQVEGVKDVLALKNESDRQE
jgi:hypothetical protein